MEIIVASRHFKVQKDVKTQIVEEMKKFDTCASKLTTAEVILNNIHHNIHVEIIIRGKHLNCKSEAETDDLLKSFYLAFKKMRNQLDKRRTKVKNHRAKHIGDLELWQLNKKQRAS